MKAMRSLFILVLACYFVGGCSRGLHSDVKYASVTRTGPDSRISSVVYGYRGNDLCFAIFENARHQLRPHGAIGFWNEGGTTVCLGAVIQPNGIVIDATTSKLLFEFTDDSHSSCAIAFTKAELDGYIASNEIPATITGLRAYLELVRCPTRRQNQRAQLSRPVLADVSRQL
jgi:hypothetical protein